MGKLPNQRAAEDTVFGNLGMSAEDLGAGELDDKSNVTDGGEDDLDTEGEGGEGPDLEADADDNQQQEGEGDQQQEENDLGIDDDRVNHTQNRQQERQPRQQQRPIPQSAEVRPDGKGNLVDAQGRMVARKGPESRFYMGMHRARQETANVTKRYNTAQANLERAVQIGQEINKELTEVKKRYATIDALGLNPTEQLEAAQMYARGKTQPVELLKDLLTRAVARGIDITQLGLQPGAVDPSSLLAMIERTIDQKMNPLKERSAADDRQRQENERLTAEQNAARQHVEDFFDSTPEARPFVRVFREALQHPKFRGWSLREIWLQIQLSNRERREARPRPGNPGIPRGRGSEQPARSNGNDMAPPDASYDDIVDIALKESGFVGR